MKRGPHSHGLVVDHRAEGARHCDKFLLSFEGGVDVFVCGGRFVTESPGEAVVVQGSCYLPVEIAFGYFGASGGPRRERLNGESWGGFGTGALWDPSSAGWLEAQGSQMPTLGACRPDAQMLVGRYPST